MKILVFDTETTGFPSPSLPLTEQPAIVQFAALQIDCDVAARRLTEVRRIDQFLDPGRPIPPEASAVHHITDAMVAGQPSFAAFAETCADLFRTSHVAVAHNLDFDRRIIECELARLGRPRTFLPDQTFDTMQAGVALCQLPGGKNGYKYPKLTELYRHFFGEDFDGAHNAMADVVATARCMKQFLSRGIFIPHEPKQAALF